MMTRRGHAVLALALLAAILLPVMAFWMLACACGLGTRGHCRLLAANFLVSSLSLILVLTRPPYRSHSDRSDRARARGVPEPAKPAAKEVYRADRAVVGAF